MDKYDDGTIKAITTQYPKDKSIQFLVRIIKEQKLERGRVESELDEYKDTLKRESRKETKTIITKEKVYKEMAKSIRILEEKVNNMRKVRDLMICRNIQLQQEIDDLKARQ